MVLASLPITSLGLLVSIAATISFAATSAAVVGNGLELASAVMVIPELAAMLVAIAPGKTIVTPTLVLSSSDLRPSVNSFMAAFDAP